MFWLLLTLIIPRGDSTTITNDGPVFNYSQRSGDSITLTPDGPAFTYTQPSGDSMTIGPDNDLNFTYGEGD